MRFYFELDSVADIAPWGEGFEAKLHWFGLTSGRYWLSTPLGEALRYTDEAMKLWELASPHVDYQIARIFEDLQSILPEILEAVPPDIALIASGENQAKIDRWLVACSENEELTDLLYEVREWYRRRALDTMYLVNGPTFHFWRTGDVITVRWLEGVAKSDPIWSLPEGQFILPVEQFRLAAYAFLDDVILAMQTRVNEIQKHGWHRRDCHLDVSLLRQEQQQRASLVAESKERSAQTDWDAVRALMQRLPEELLNQP